MQHRGLFGVNAVKRVPPPYTVCEVAVRLRDEARPGYPRRILCRDNSSGSYFVLVSNRTDFCRVQGLPNVGLNDLVAA